MPVISVDTKKKELVGNFKNGGREWQPKGEPDLVDVHDFPSDAVGKAIPYRVYVLAANEGFVSVGVDHDTPVFAVRSIEAWWSRVGAKRYDMQRQTTEVHDYGRGRMTSEPVFVRKPGAAAEDEGWIMSLCLRPGTRPERRRHP